MLTQEFFKKRKIENTEDTVMTEIKGMPPTIRNIVGEYALSRGDYFKFYKNTPRHMELYIKPIVDDLLNRFKTPSPNVSCVFDAWPEQERTVFLNSPYVPILLKLYLLPDRNHFYFTAVAYRKLIIPHLLEIRDQFDIDLLKHFDTHNNESKEETKEEETKEEETTKLPPQLIHAVKARCLEHPLSLSEKSENKKISNALYSLAQQSSAHLNLPEIRLKCEESSLELNLQGANLKKACLIGNIVNANLCEADLTGALFRNLILKNTNLRKAILNNALFVRAELIDTDLTEATLDNIEFCIANLTRANLSQARLKPKDTNLSDHFIQLPSNTLAGADFRNVKILGEESKQLIVNYVSDCKECLPQFKPLVEYFRIAPHPTTLLTLVLLTSLFPDRTRPPLHNMDEYIHALYIMGARNYMEFEYRVWDIPRLVKENILTTHFGDVIKEIRTIFYSTLKEGTSSHRAFIQDP